MEGLREVQQGQVLSPALESHEPQAVLQAGAEGLQSCSAERDLGVLVNSSRTRASVCVQVATKAIGILACISSSVASRTRAGIVDLHSALVRLLMIINGTSY